MKISVLNYCNKNKLPNIGINYGNVPENSKAIFLQYPPSIKIWDHYYDWLFTIKNEKDRVVHVYSTILHELYHYKQYLYEIKKNRHDKYIVLDEKEAYDFGYKQANIVVEKLTKEQINPMKKNPISSSLYEDFHGMKPQKRTPIKFVNPTGELIKIGKVSRIDYVPGENSQHVGINFFHKTGDTGDKKLKSNWILAVDKSGKHFYLIKEDESSSYPVFTGRGIIG